MAISNLYFNENWLWKTRKNEQVTLEIEEPVTLRGGGACTGRCMKCEAFNWKPPACKNTSQQLKAASHRHTKFTPR